MTMLNIKERAFKNISYSLLSFTWPVLVAFIVTPIVVNHYGIKEYGIYIFINTLISLAGLLDIGFAGAVSKFMAERHGGNDKEGSRNLFKTANTIFFVIGILGAIFIISSIFLGLVTFPGEVTVSYEAYIPSFIYAGILFFINSINSLHILLPTAYQRFDIGSKIGLSFITVQQISILLVIFFNGSINTLFLVQTVLMFVFYFVYKKFTTSILPPGEQHMLRVYGWSKRDATECYKFGVVSFLNNIAGVSLTYLDRMVIPLFLGPSNLTFYSLPGSVTNKIPTLSATLSAVVFPMTSHFEGQGNRDMVKNLYVRSMRLILIVSASITVTFIAFAYPLLQYWISIELAEKATAVLIILAITNFFLAGIGLINSLLLGMSKLRPLIIASIFTALINAILLVILLPKLGIVGAAYAYLFALVPYGFLIYKIEKKYLGLSLRGAHYFKLTGQIFITSVVVFLADYFLIKPYISSFPIALLSSGLSSILFLVIYYFMGFFEKEDVHDISNFVKKTLIRKFNIR